MQIARKIDKSWRMYEAQVRLNVRNKEKEIDTKLSYSLSISYDTFRSWLTFSGI